MAFARAADGALAEGEGLIILLTKVPVFSVAPCRHV